MTHGQSLHNRKRIEKKEKRANYTKLVLVCSEICGGKPENMYVNISKICENMCL